MTILPDIINTFTKQYPAIHLTLVEEAALSLVRHFEKEPHAGFGAYQSAAAG